MSEQELLQLMSEEIVGAYFATMIHGADVA